MRGSLAWLVIVGFVPVVGAALYLMIGERRVARRRTERYASQRHATRNWIKGLEETGSLAVDWSRHPPSSERMSRLGEAASGVHTLLGNELALISDTEEILRSIVADVECAESTVHMAFYVLHPGGTADEVAEEILRARERDVPRSFFMEQSAGIRRVLDRYSRSALRRSSTVVSSQVARPLSEWRDLPAHPE